jgi:hypothetical protein
VLPPGAEKRLTPRHSCSLAALTQVHIPGSRQRFFAWVHDISAGGVALDMRTPLQSGKEVLCRLKGLEAHECFEVRALVVHVRLSDGLYRTGCRFLEPLPSAHLAAVLRKLRGTLQAASA